MWGTMQKLRVIMMAVPTSTKSQSIAVSAEELHMIFRCSSSAPHRVQKQATKCAADQKTFICLSFERTRHQRSSEDSDSLLGRSRL